MQRHLRQASGSNFCDHCGVATRPAQIVCIACGCALRSVFASPKSKVAAGLLAIFLGFLGIHKFYLGYKKTGAIMLAVSIGTGWLTAGLGLAAMWLVGVIEGIIYPHHRRYEGWLHPECIADHRACTRHSADRSR